MIIHRWVLKVRTCNKLCFYSLFLDKAFDSGTKDESKGLHNPKKVPRACDKKICDRKYFVTAIGIGLSGSDISKKFVLFVRFQRLRKALSPGGQSSIEMINRPEFRSQGGKQR